MRRSSPRNMFTFRCDGVRLSGCPVDSDWEQQDDPSAGLNGHLMIARAHVRRCRLVLSEADGLGSIGMELDPSPADEASCQERVDSLHSEQLDADCGVCVEHMAGQASEPQLNVSTDRPADLVGPSRHVVAPSMPIPTPPSTIEVASSSKSVTREDFVSTPVGTVEQARAHARVLGRPVLLDADRQPVRNIREAAVELLVFLATHRDGASIEAVKEAVYGGANRASAAQRLSTDLASLRNRIRHALGEAQGVNPVVNEGGRYRLDSDLVDVDWWSVEDAAGRAQKAEDRDSRIEALREGLNSFHGVLADGTDYGWLSAHQERSRRVGVGLHVRLAIDVAGTDPVETARLLEAACELEPYDEDLAVHAMRAHAVVGDREAVRVRMHRLRTALAELDESPEPATVELVARLTSRTTLNPRRVPARPAS